MSSSRLTHILATSALAATLAGSIVTPSQAIPLPVTSAQAIAGAVPTEHVQWWGGWGWRGYGWRRPYYGGGALAAGVIGGLALGALAASTSYYGYSYPYYSYGYYPASYSYPAYYGYYPSYYRAAYYSAPYSWGGGYYWASGKRVQKPGRKHMQQVRR
jgi:hypothetical protein